MKAFIEAHVLQKAFGGKVVLKDINLRIREGKLVSIVGPFGSGKTTLLKIIAGFIDDYKGEINIGGLNPIDLIKKGYIGFCFQKPNLLPWLTVEKNLLLPSVLQKTKPKYSVNNLLKMVGLSSIKTSTPGQLSGGTQQLISILRSLSLNPKLLLLDEPFSSIDEINREKLQDKLLDIHKKTEKTTILITHSVNEAVFLSDTVVILSKEPAGIKKVININLNRSGNNIRTSEDFLNYVKNIRKYLDA